MPETRRLRIAGFVLTAAGALLAGIGTIAPWTSTGLRGDLEGVLDLEFRGIDLVEGIVALAVAVTTLVGLVIVRRVRGDTRIRVAVGLLIAGGLLVGLPAWVALRAEARAIEEVARVVVDAVGITVEEAIDRVRTDPDLALRTETGGAWLSVAGGALVVIGAGVTLAWAVRTAQTPADEAA